MKLRLLATSDLQTRVGWMNDPRVYKTMHFTPPISLERTIEWHSKNLNNPNRCDVAFEDELGNLVAMGGLTAIDYTVRKAEFYIFVNPERQREGIGSQATYLLCKYGFEVLQLHKIYLYTNASNTGARHTYEKVGFSLEGVHRSEMIAGEKYEDRLYYGLLAADFEGNKHPLDFSGMTDVRIDSCKIGNCDIKIVRDDLFPEIGGGYKIT